MDLDHMQTPLGINDIYLRNIKLSSEEDLIREIAEHMGAHAWFCKWFKTYFTFGLFQSC